MRGGRIGLGVAAALLVASAGTARAQQSPGETPPGDRATTVPESGVVKPPPTADSGLRKPPPANGSTIQVIPPPGTAGNQPNVVPK